MIKKVLIFLSLILLKPLHGSSQSYLLIGKDTLRMSESFISDPIFKLKITTEDMSFETCLSDYYIPTWKIENDSFFLIKLGTAKNSEFIDLENKFIGRYINNRIFASEITYRIEAQFYKKHKETNSDSVFCLRIENGIVQYKSTFENKTEYIDKSEYLSPEAIQKNTDWSHLPPIEADRLVTVKIKTDDSGKIIEAVVVENSNRPYDFTNIIKMQGEEVWQKEALRQVRLIPKWDVIYKCGQVVDKEDTLEFLFSKRQ